MKWDTTIQRVIHYGCFFILISIIIVLMFPQTYSDEKVAFYAPASQSIFIFAEKIHSHDYLYYASMHEYGHYVWYEKLTETQRQDFTLCWEKSLRKVTSYAHYNVKEGWAEAYAYYYHYKREDFKDIRCMLNLL